MKNYHDLLQAVLDHGEDQFNTRTGEICRALVGYQLQYDLREGFPALTTRKLPFRNIVGELLGFFRGYDSAADFRALGCHFWDKNANETEAWLANPERGGRRDFLGRIYGKQWTDWRDSRVVTSAQERDSLRINGYFERLHDVERGAWLMERGINQLEEALKKLITNPSDRRVIVSGWRPDEFDRMALPPCHMDYRFVAFEDPKVLHVVMTIRSWDLFLGAPANVASTAIFLSIMARLAGYEPGIVTIQATNAHIYSSHFDAVRELLSREHLDVPRLQISDRVKRVIGFSEIPGVFARIEPDDIQMEGYESHAPIRAVMAA
jgi:thymidylate synthase